MDTDFDLNLLRVLVALDSTRSVTRAAIELGMSQSGFSTALARLRRRLNDPLFVRTSHGMEATAYAAATVETAKAVLDEIKAGILDRPVFDPLTAKTEFQLAMTDVAEIAYLPALLQHLQKVAPNVTLRTGSWSRAGLRDAMENGQADLAIGYFPDLASANVYGQRLYSHTYACMLRKGHPALRQLTESVYGDLGHAIVVAPSRSDELLEHFLESRHLQRRVMLRTPHHLSLPAVIEKTDLIATVPLASAAFYSRIGLVALAPLPFEPPFIQIQQYWHRRGHNDPRVRWLQAQIAELFNDASDEWISLEQSLYGNIRRRPPSLRPAKN